MGGFPFLASDRRPWPRNVCAGGRGDRGGGCGGAASGGFGPVVLRERASMPEGVFVAVIYTLNAIWLAVNGSKRALDIAVLC